MRKNASSIEAPRSRVLRVYSALACLHRMNSVGRKWRGRAIVGQETLTECYSIWLILNHARRTKSENVEILQTKHVQMFIGSVGRCPNYAHSHTHRWSYTETLHFCSPITVGVGLRIRLSVCLSVCLYEVCLGHAHKLRWHRGSEAAGQAIASIALMVVGW